MIEINLYLALNEKITILFDQPVTALITNPQTKMDQVG